ncbi:MAG: hypothetical protein ACRCSP_03375 [Rhodoglobus sp.]
MTNTGFSIIKLRAAMGARFAGHGPDSGVAMLTAILFGLLTVGLSVVLLSTVLAQSTPAYTAQKNTRTIYAAQSGLQVALGVIRSVDLPPNAANKVFGDLSKLPCAVKGRVNAQTDGTNYDVTVIYFLEDPTSKDSTWRDANKLSCNTSTGLTISPKFAYLRSDGLGLKVPGISDDTYGNRYLSAVYKFKTANENIPGGMIFDSTREYCLQATTATNGSQIKFVPKSQCLGTPLQLWWFSPTYQIRLASTVQLPAVLGLCITGPVDEGQSTQDALLRPCKSQSASGLDRWNQLWSWVGKYTWQGSKKTDPIESGKSDHYLSPTLSAGQNLSGTLLKVVKGSTSIKGTLAPDSEVGAGAASYATGQLVNYKEFGRCADVTNEDMYKDYLISYPCKQDPSGPPYPGITWNHKWAYTEAVPPIQLTTGTITTVFGGTDPAKGNLGQTYCLQRISGSVYPLFRACTGNQNQQWQRSYDTGTYSSSYLLSSPDGSTCLTADSTDMHNLTISKITIKGCNGSDEQKWNAPVTTTSSDFGDFREVNP